MIGQRCLPYVLIWVTPTAFFVYIVPTISCQHVELEEEITAHQTSWTNLLSICICHGEMFLKQTKEKSLFLTIQGVT